VDELGYGKYAAEYGNAQAAFFLKKDRPASQIMVADSPDYAFNEYVQITVELGIVGLIIFLLTIGSTLFFCNSPFSIFHSSFLAFLVFAVFSYPFSVLPLSIFFVVLLALLAPSSSKLSISFPLRLQMGFLAICWSITAFGAYQILSKRDAYSKMSSLQMHYQINHSLETVDNYLELYPALRHEKVFLFELGQILSKSEQFAESNGIFEEYLRIDSDPMIYNCMGNNYKSLGAYSKAEKMYIRASQIVPNRHYPLYLLMKLYQETHQTDKAIAIAETLLNKPVKVPSTAIREMRDEARKLIIKYEL